MWLSFHSVGILPLPKSLVHTQGSRSNFEIGGGGARASLVPQYLGGRAQDTFSF